MKTRSGPIRLPRGCQGPAAGAWAWAMSRPSPLDDLRNSTHAWARFRWLMKLMAGITATVVGIAMVLIYLQNGLASIHLYIATALGIGVAMALTAFLMGLVFLSSGTGHDESISTGEADPHDQANGRNR